MFKKLNKEELKWQDIEIKIMITKDKISWTANVDSVALIFYLNRVIHFINKELDDIK
ncbi:MAG: hypothetical protein ACYDIA_01675 [Candidatus Humimicrobiaceae bacterium]